jgi:hypothetical protein
MRGSEGFASVTVVEMPRNFNRNHEHRAERESQQSISHF